MKAVILAGGFGTRLGDETNVRPKPMVEVAGRPLLWHVMEIYALQGITNFVVALGYRGDAIKQYIYNYHYLHGDLTVRLADGKVEVSPPQEDWSVDLVETGTATGTGGRMRRVAQWIGGETFMLTYGDGLCDIDLDSLLRFHREHGRLATVTAVRPPARFGSLTMKGDLVTRFAEKPQVSEGWVNGGFFVLEPEVLERIQDDQTNWEDEPLESLAADGQLAAYRHEGFWHCVDTKRDLLHLERLAHADPPPWRLRT